MNSIWAIFVDISGSMAEPFSGKGDFAGVTERGAYRTKLDAAKDTVLRQIRGLPSGEVAVVAFSSRAHLVHRGRSDETERFEEPIQSLVAGGTTNIAGTLLFALNELGDLGTYRIINFLVITDGLSNVGDPRAAARECADSLMQLRISTVLIDPTSEGEEIARAISIGGDVRAVTSYTRLEEAVVEEKAALVTQMYMGFDIEDIKNPRRLREWWHYVLRTQKKRFPCYGIFLVLPSDEEVFRYLSETGKELDVISGEDCLLIILGKTEYRFSGFEEGVWGIAVKEHFSEGLSVRVARLFDIPFNEFPCLLLFQDIRSSEHVMVSLKEMTSGEIRRRLRSVFSIISQAAADNENPLVALRNQREAKELLRMKSSIVSELRSFAGKTFEKAMEAWMKSLIK